MNRNFPRVIISEEGEKWLDNEQMWMYKNNVVKLDENIENGALVDIVTTKDRYLGTGFLSRNSHITVRILSKDTADTLPTAVLFSERQISFPGLQWIAIMIFWYHRSVPMDWNSERICCMRCCLRC